MVARPLAAGQFTLGCTTHLEIDAGDEGVDQYQFRKILRAHVRLVPGRKLIRPHASQHGRAHPLRQRGVVGGGGGPVGRDFNCRQHILSDTGGFDDNIIFKGATVYGIVGRRISQTWLEMRGLIRSGAIDLAPMVTHRFALDDYEKAFALMASGQCGKVVMFPDSSLSDGPLS